MVGRYTRSQRPNGLVAGLAASALNADVLALFATTTFVTRLFLIRATFRDYEDHAFADLLPPSVLAVGRGGSWVVFFVFLWAAHFLNPPQGEYL